MEKIKKRDLVWNINDNSKLLPKNTIFTVTKVNYLDMIETVCLDGFGDQEFDIKDFVKITTIANNQFKNFNLLKEINEYDYVKDLKSLMPAATGILKETETKPVLRGGTKHDSGKPKIRFLTREFLEGIAEAQTFGSKKYGDWNFQKGLETTALYDAMMRHMLAWMSGESLDPESGLSHLAHAGANLNMLMWTLNNKPEMDNRPKK